MRQSIESRLAKLEKALDPCHSGIGEIVIYDPEKGIPKELRQDKRIPVLICIPDNGRDPGIPHPPRAKHLRFKTIGVTQLALCISFFSTHPIYDLI